jgi:UDP-N-acetylglucosamine--N-acetylmuramyl-(pentapeptide) pyrophosphoryl-undecaprenol N-acetylglucosamine transferase
MAKYFPENSLVYSGNPIRTGIQLELPPKEKGLLEFNLQPELPVLLVLGGSLGAKRINAFVASQLPYFESQGIQLLWQCGALYYDQYKDLQSNTVQLFDFITNMPLAYTAANYVISRAGAGAVSELMLVGKPAFFIPSPNVAEDHQTKNAEAVVAMGAGEMIREADLENNFKTVFESIIKDLALQSSMREAMQKMAKPEATETIVKTIEKIIEKHPK